LWELIFILNVGVILYIYRVFLWIGCAFLCNPFCYLFSCLVSVVYWVKCGWVEENVVWVMGGVGVRSMVLAVVGLIDVSNPIGVVGGVKGVKGVKGCQ
jgi:hypothetical protein